MCHLQFHKRNRRVRLHRQGMTLAELIAVSFVLVVMAGAMGALALGVQESNQFNYEHGVSLQHGQVTVQRIQRTLNSATANGTFPGFLVFADTIASQPYPDTLVVWNPTGSAIDPDGLPRMNELIVYCPNPNNPQELWEIRAASDTRVAPDPSNTSQWNTELAYLKSNSSVQRVVLTNVLRTASTSTGRRGVIRFQTRLRPSQLEWSQYIAGQRSWQDLSWVQGIYGASTGLRQSWCRFELQLRPGDTTDNRRDATIPFFGSGAVIYELHKP